MIEVTLKVVPNSKKFSISKKDSIITVHIKSPPQKNKANIELIKNLSSLFDRDVRLIRGQTSSKKTLQIDISPQRWDCFLSALE